MDMRKATRKISLLLILCMFVSMLPASVAADNSEWLAASVEPADETPAADAGKYDSSDGSATDYIMLTAEDLAESTAEDVTSPDDFPEDAPMAGEWKDSGVRWTFTTGSRTLSIDGKGEMPQPFADSDIPWKSYKDKIEKITIDSRVTFGEECAFPGYSNLLSLTVPAGTAFGASAFAGCDKLASVTVDGKWKYLDRKLNILAGVDPESSAAPWAALKDRVTEIVIAAGVKDVPGSAFNGMTALTDDKDNRPPVIHYEGKAEDWPAVSDAADEKGLTVDSKYLLVRFKDGSLIGKCGDTATFVFDGVDTLTISGSGPASVSSENKAPWYSVREAVEKIVIADGVTGVTDNTFTGMNLTDSKDKRPPAVYYGGTETNWTTVGGAADGKGLKFGDQYLLVRFSDGSLIGKCGDNATFEFNGVDTLTISGSGKLDVFTMYTMPWYSIRAKIKTLIIDPNITSIGDYAFFSCTALTGVEIPANVTSIGSCAFAECSKLENLTIRGGSAPDLAIGRYAFWLCSSLKNIGSPATRDEPQTGLPTRVKTIGEAAFRSTGLVYKKGGTAGHIYYEGSRAQWAEINKDKDSPNVRDGKLLTGGTSTDEDTYAIVHCMTADPDGSLYHGLKFEGGYGTEGSAPNLTAIPVISSIVTPANAIIGETVAEDTNFEIPPCSFTRKAYTFKGWLCNADNEIYTPGDPFIMPAADVVFTAQWTLDTPLKGDAIDQIIENFIAEKKKGTSDYPWKAPQDAASSQTELLNWLYNTAVPANLSKAIADSKDDTIKASYRIQVQSFHQAYMGIENMPNGQNGRFAFDLHLTFRQTDGKEIKATASVKDGVITATKYNKAKDAGYTVTFVLNGGVLPKPFAPDNGYEIITDTKVQWTDIRPGKTFRLPVCKDNTGADLEFNGWRCTLEGSEVNNFTYRANAEFMMRTAEVTFTADWKDPVAKPSSVSAFQAVAAAGAPQPKVSNLESLVRSELEAGKSASVILEAAPVDTKSPEVMRLRAASLEGSMTFVDLTLRKTVEGETSAITDTGDALIAVTLPFDGKNAENVKVYRDHEGEVDVLTEGGSGERIAVAGDSLTIYATKFSVYAIAFDRKSSGSGAVRPGTGGGSSGSSSKPSIISHEGGASGPATGGGVPDGNPPSKKRFNDVAPDAWYYEAANWAYDQKIAKGEGGKRFNPNKLCTRAEMLTFLWRALGSPEPSGTGRSFSDVPSGAYYAKAVQWAAGQKIVKGEGGKRFNPDAPVTRGEAITLLYRAVGAPAAAGARFNDVPESAYYAEAVEWAVSRDVAKGMGKRSFSPASPCTRAQVLTFLYRSQS